MFYHCFSRVVDRRFVLGTEEKEKFRTLMRMQENFTGCRVVAYCVMDNHFHLLLEVPPMPENGLSDGELLKRLSGDLWRGICGGCGGGIGGSAATGHGSSR